LTAKEDARGGLREAVIGLLQETVRKSERVRGFGFSTEVESRSPNAKFLRSEKKLHGSLQYYALPSRGRGEARN